MFPLSQEFTSYLWFAVLHSFFIICFLQLPKSKRYFIPPLWGRCSNPSLELCEYGFQPTRLWWTPEYLIVALAVAIFILSLILAFVINLIFEWLYDRKNGAVRQSLVLAFALLPVICLTGYNLNSQYIPSSLCSDDKINVTLGQNEYAVRRDYSSMMRMKVADHSSGSQLEYSHHRDDKYDVKQICELTNGGNNSLSIHTLWIRPSDLKERVLASCKTGSKYAPQLCSALGTLNFEDLDKIILVLDSEFTLNSYGLAARNVENVQDLKDKVDVLAVGDQQSGHVCRPSPFENVGGVSCTKWRMVDQDTLLLASTRYMVGLSNVEVLARVSPIIDFTMSDLLRF